MVAQFQWTQKRQHAALKLAEGKTQNDIVRDLGVARRTLCYWLKDSEFKAEVDRLSCMIFIASRAERMRIAMRAVRARVKGQCVETDKDVLDWLKFAQSETNGIKLELTRLSKPGSEAHA
jgi:hypothetical protein